MTFKEKLESVGVFETGSTKRSILSYVYQHRIYISCLLDENLPQDVLDFVENFLNTDSEYDGDESEAWSRILDKDFTF